MGLQGGGRGRGRGIRGGREGGREGASPSSLGTLCMLPGARWLPGLPACHRACAHLQFPADPAGPASHCGAPYHHLQGISKQALQEEDVSRIVQVGGACLPARLLACLPAQVCSCSVVAVLLPVCLSASACPLLQTLEYDSKVESICDDDDGLTHYRLVSLPACLPACPRGLPGTVCWLPAPMRARHPLPAVRCGQAAGSLCGRAALAGLHAEAAPHLTTCPPARAPHPAAPDAPA